MWSRNWVSKGETKTHAIKKITKTCYVGFVSIYVSPKSRGQNLMYQIWATGKKKIWAADNMIENTLKIFFLSRAWLTRLYGTKVPRLTELLWESQLCTGSGFTKHWSVYMLERATRPLALSRATLFPCPIGTLLGTILFLPCKRFDPGCPPSRGEKTAMAALHSKVSFDVNCLWWLYSKVTSIMSHNINIFCMFHRNNKSPSYIN